MSSKKHKPSYIDGRLAFAQMDEDAKRVIVRAALSQHMRFLGRKVNNQREDKRAIISAAMKRRWDSWRAKKKAEQHAYNTAKGLPLDTPLPAVPKVKKVRIYTRTELLDIASAELDRAFPKGLTKENEKEFMAFKPKDPRLKGHV